MPQVASEITEAFAIADRDPMTLVPDGHPALADQVSHYASALPKRADDDSGHERDLGGFRSSYRPARSQRRPGRDEASQGAADDGRSVRADDLHRRRARAGTKLSAIRSWPIASTARSPRPSPRTLRRLDHADGLLDWMTSMPLVSSCSRSCPPASCPAACVSARAECEGARLLCWPCPCAHVAPPSEVADPVGL